MPHFTFPLSPDGLAVHGVVGLNGSDMVARMQAGQPVPRPVAIRALLDTGCDVTTVSPQVIQSFGLTPEMQTSTQTAGGSVPVDLYSISLSVFGPALAPSPLLTRQDLLVMELTVGLPNVDVLIGLDVLNECLLVHDGPGRQFILGF